MKRNILLNISLLFPILVYGQTFEDSIPINFYYNKITFSDLPVLSRNKQGVVFYHMSGMFVKKHFNQQLNANYASVSDKLEFYKFKKDKYRYRNYRFQFGVQDLRDSTLNGIRDSSDIQVIADKFRKRWSWRRFRIIEVPLGQTTIYSGYVVFQIKFSPSPDYQHCLQDTTSLPVYYIRNLINQRELVLNGKMMPSWLFANLRDRLMESYQVLDRLNKNQIYLRYLPENEELLIYMNVFYNP